MDDAAAIVARAERLLADSLSSTTRRERRRQARLAAVTSDPRLRELTFALTDEVLRFTSARRAGDRLQAIVGQLGVPRSLGLLDRMLLRAGSAAAAGIPGVVMPLVHARLRAESRGVVIPADDPGLRRHLARRAAEGFGLNVNLLGEAILSDAEATRRTDALLALIARPDVDYVSLKISAVVANLDVLAIDHSVERVCERLRQLYRAARQSRPPTFLNLDMEEFRDLPLTLAAFTRVLDEDEFGEIDAGVVLQAYLPDSHAECDRLGEWAKRRHERGGGRIKIRVVKGANLAMERVEAEVHGWEQAPYPTKADVDASFKALVGRALDPRWSPAVRVGVASHNLFDLAWAMQTLDPSRVDIEMLEGMAPAQARSIRATGAGVLLYAPVVRDADRVASIAYLTRRLDENTSPDNFLRALFTLRPGSAEWHRQRDRFEASLDAGSRLATTSRRRQDRTAPPSVVDLDGFSNCADTDWTRAANRAWISRHLGHAAPPEPPIVADKATIDVAVGAARRAATRWASEPTSTRRQLLSAVATELESGRGSTIAVMAHTAAKTIVEGDAEVSEAVDFARYYRWCTHAIDARVARGRRFTPAGVVLVASPWNFPYAIPAGGVLAALAAGNAAILKPAPEARPVAAELVRQFHRAGVPEDLVQLVATDDDDFGRHLVTHDGVDVVVLTGSYETAQLFRSWRPSIRLAAETSGKNAIVVTAAADEDAAIRDLVRSAFGHAGQKCSAASLAILEAPVHDDSSFLTRLADAVRSIRVGAAADPATMMGPLVVEPSEKLLRALTTLDPGERWLVEPRRLDVSRHLWTPGVRAGVRPGSWFHRTECFGPVLGVMRADDLDHAIELQNGTAYGLTGGIQSLDEREVEHWIDRVEVGNAYVNRPITGAIVQRQPFGGWKRSSTGCGPKAGGPWYVESLGSWSLDGDGAPDDEADLERVGRDMLIAERDPSGLASESNVLRYEPLRRMAVHAGDDADPVALAFARAAARAIGIAAVDASGADLAGVERVRVVGMAPDELLDGWHQQGLEVDSTPPVADAEIEMRRWIREQAVSTTRHRHGRVPERRLDAIAAPP